MILWRPAYEGSPPTWRVQLALAEKGATWEERRVSFGEKPAGLLAANPRGQVPTLEHGAARVYETDAILLYLEHALPGPALLPAGPARATALTRTEEVSGYLMSAFLGFWRYRGSTPAEQRDPDREAAFVAGVKEEWARWEAFLAAEGTGWFAGEALSLADLSVYPYLASCLRNGLPTAELPHLAAFAARMAERPAVRRTWPWPEGSQGEPLFA